LQELALAKDIIFHYGKKTIAADSLSAALTTFRVYQQAITGTPYRGPLRYVPMEFDASPYMMLSTRRTTDLEFIKLPLHRLLQAACSYNRRIHRLEATDPRDTVYALLGLSSDAEERGIYPDYTKPCRQVFAEVSRIYMKLEGDPRFLSLCYFPKQQPDLPSWVPDWSAVSNNRERPICFEWGPDKLIGGNVRPPFAAPGELPYDREAQTDDLSLFRLKGAIIDTIKAALGEDIKRKCHDISL
jgi:hypothetical protein